MSRTTIWTINEVASLLAPHAEEILDILGRDKVKFGDRTKFNDSDPKDDSINLMQSAEYFVPIMPKCIGDKFKLNNPILNKIQQYYKTKSQEKYSYFWEDICFEKNECKMYTKKCIGYYSILESTAPNILIGYSQGGVVARYLEWLDKQVFKQDVVKGVITIASPNFGSPLANPDNMLNVFLGYVKILAILSDGYLKEDTKNIIQTISDLLSGKGKIQKKGFSEGYRTLLPDISTFINEFLQYILEKLKETGNEKLYYYVSIWYRWSGGMRNDPNNAFYDLNILRAGEPYSVLNSINNYDISCSKIFNIITANNDPSVFFEEVKVTQDIFQMIETFIRKYKSDNPVIAEVIRLMIELIILSDSRGETTPDKIDLKAISDVYNKQVMLERGKAPSNKLIRERIDGYNKGIKGLKLKSYSHDFIIPSSYQVVSNGQNTNSYNIVNFGGNHLTTMKMDYKAGQDTYNTILELLKSFF